MANNLAVASTYSGCASICSGGRHPTPVNVDPLLNGNYMITIKINVKYNFFALKNRTKVFLF